MSAAAAEVEGAKVVPPLQMKMEVDYFASLFAPLVHHKNKHYVFYWLLEMYYAVVLFRYAFPLPEVRQMGFLLPPLLP